VGVRKERGEREREGEGGQGGGQRERRERGGERGDSFLFPRPVLPKGAVTTERTTRVFSLKVHTTRAVVAVFFAHETLQRPAARPQPPSHSTPARLSLSLPTPVPSLSSNGSATDARLHTVTLSVLGVGELCGDEGRGEMVMVVGGEGRGVEARRERGGTAPPPFLPFFLHYPFRRTGVLDVLVCA
jgi:hypothetical protein